jgi:hypothetical protein
MNTFYLIGVAVCLPLLVVLALITWIWGLRPYLRRHGKACTTGARIDVSMWSDWTEVWELGRQQGRIPACAAFFLALHIVGVLVVVVVVIGVTWGRRMAE